MIGTVKVRRKRETDVFFYRLFFQFHLHPLFFKFSLSLSLLSLTHAFETPSFFFSQGLIKARSTSQHRSDQFEAEKGGFLKRDFSSMSTSTTTSPPPPRPQLPPPPVLLRCLLLAAFLLAMLSASLAPEPKYLLVIDAGSSGTRM